MLKCFVLLMQYFYSISGFLDFITYNDEYDEENYLYDENEEDTMEEETQTFLPVFTSSPTTYRIIEGHTAR